MNLCDVSLFSTSLLLWEAEALEGSHVGPPSKVSQTAQLRLFRLDFLKLANRAITGKESLTKEHLMPPRFYIIISPRWERVTASGA